MLSLPDYDIPTLESVVMKIINILKNDIFLTLLMLISGVGVFLLFYDIIGFPFSVVPAAIGMLVISDIIDYFYAKKESK